MSRYRYHVFFCTNRRTGGRQCCQDHDAQRVRDYAKQRCKTLGCHGAGKVRINTAGCLDRCAAGPVMVVYPEATWYQYVDEADVDEIIESHLCGGQVVKRLLLDD